MGIIDEIRRDVQEISNERGLTEDRGFGYWFLERYEDLSPEEAEEVITDGPWDAGRDAVYFDEDNSMLKIYQFKYSPNQNYIKRALRDVQNGLRAEEQRLSQVEIIRLIIVTIASADSELRKASTRVEKQIRRWLERKGYKIDVKLELVDLKRFLELSERLYGVNVSLKWKAKKVVDGRSLIGLVDVSGLKDFIDRDELFSFNIRRFLGLRKGSVSWKIKQSLEDNEKRKNFWILNNGIVCLCTNFKEQDNVVAFQNFTIVNGAQTVSTISRFLEENPVIDDPIWVVAKVLKVPETEVELAAEITEASNTQTPTSSRDLRATDLIHPKIGEWLQSEFNLIYVYKRGQRATNAVKMKDLAQAYITFWHDEPHISFSRPGQIFANPTYYGYIFPSNEIENLKQYGEKVEIRRFLLKRLIPWKITIITRKYLYTITGPNTNYDKKFRSLTYHITWLYKKLMEEKLEDHRFAEIYQQLDSILQKSLEIVFEKVYDFLSYTKIEIPRALKSTEARNKLLEFTSLPQFQNIKREVQNMI
jgi:hypothetical protein